MEAPELANNQNLKLQQQESQQSSENQHSFGANDALDKTMMTQISTSELGNSQALGGTQGWPGRRYANQTDR